MANEQNVGYDDTPILPGTPWHVHDGNRPQPPVVTPGTEGCNAEPGQPPSDAVVLFDGSSLDGWVAQDGGAAQWTVTKDYMEVVPGTGSIRTREQIGDCQLHLEFASPSVAEGDSQGRGNSGVFLMGRYEIQVLDCYDNLTYPDGTTGAIYGQYPPLVNACRKPGEWQMYDIIWVAPRFDGDALASEARVTVLLNGIVLQHDQALLGVTAHKVVTTYEPHPPAGPLQLQDHNDLVRFRNIWYRPM